MKNVRYLYLVLFFFFYIVINIAVRVVLLFNVGSMSMDSLWRFVLIFAFGMINDIPVFLLMAIPLAAFVLLPKKYPIKKWYKCFLGVLFTIYIGLFLFVAVAEYLFWDELYCRFNFIAVDYLIYTTEVLRNINESYPVVFIVTGILILAVILSWLSFFTLKKFEFVYAPSSRKVFYLWIFLASICFFYTPPTVSKNFLIQDLSSNGVWSLFSAFWNNQLNYRQFYPTIDEHEAFELVHGQLLEPGSIFFSDSPWEWRRYIYSKNTEKKLNVVEIIVESLGMVALGERTPYLNTLIKNSLYCSNMKATGTRTVRGLEALILSIPPMPGASIVRRPNNEEMFTTGSVFQDRGYDTVFVYGGYGYFDNMNAFFSGNNFRIVDRAVIPEEYKTFSNAWGICDGDLFDAALREADASHALHKPFYQVVLTTSNHRPFTYPDGKVDVPSGKSRTGAIKYTDYAINKFLEDARSKPWFDDTIFIIVADHTAGSAGETVLPPDNYSIPCIFYSPKHIRPQEVDVLCSQIDVAPTLFALLNWEYSSGFWGRNILTLPKEEGRAWIATYQLVGYMTDDFLVVLEPRKNPVIEKLNGKNQPLIKSEMLEKITIATYQTAQDLFMQGKLKKAFIDYPVTEHAQDGH